jgi:hypothetical protein
MRTTPESITTRRLHGGFGQTFETLTKNFHVTAAAKTHNTLIFNCFPDTKRGKSKSVR